MKGWKLLPAAARRQRTKRAAAPAKEETSSQGPSSRRFSQGPTGRLPTIPAPRANHTAGLIRSRARVEAGERAKPVNMARRTVMASARLAARKTTKPTHTASRV